MADSTASGGVVTDTTAADVTAVNPVVKVYGSIIPRSYGQRIWQTSGIQPSKATIWLGGADDDSTGPVTLNRRAYGINRLDPVTITDGNKTLFSGLMMSRQDQGDSNTVMWEAWDWRWLLQGIPVTGCFMYDEVRDAVYYNRRASCHMNPGGRWNCIINSGIPVFTHIATEHIESGDLGEVLYDTTDVEGKVCPWTPARALKYLAWCANLGADEVSNTSVPAWRSLRDSSYLLFRMDSTNIAGVDASYYAVLPDTSLEAKSMAGAIDTLIKLAGVIDLRVAYNGDIATMQFFATKLSNNQREQVGASCFYLQRGGTALDACTAYDFDLHESSARQFGAVAINGAPVRIETSLTYDPDDVANSTLSDASSESERWAWSKIVNGVYVSGRRYAYKPASIPADGDWGSDAGSNITWVKMDGTGGNPVIYANTEAAMRMARSFLPKPWRTVKINVANLKANDIHLGVDNAFNGENFLETPRPVLLEQLQRMVTEYAASKTLKARCPVTILLDDKPALANDGLTVLDDGTILLPGLTEEAGAAADSMYNGTIRGPGTVTLKKITINVAFPHDFRTVGYASRAGFELVAGEIGGPPLMMQDAGDSYPIEHQVNSIPLPHLQTVPATTGTGTDAVPLTRVLRDEQSRAHQAAQRLLADKGEPEISSQWSLIGIRTDYEVGTWIDRVMVYGATDDSDFPINAPLKSVLYDFENQVTVCGGVLHSSVRPANVIPLKTPVPIDE